MYDTQDNWRINRRLGPAIKYLVRLIADRAHPQPQNISISAAIRRLLNPHERSA
jgi:hypothetical protein